ncbi:MAG TPA: PAS domain-containing protein, partial [Nitrospiria bacterium]
MIEPSQFQDEDKQFASLRSAEILERITDAFVALDANWRYTYVNRKAAEIFGRKPEDLIGKHIWTEFPEGVGQPFYHAYHKAMAEQVPIQIEEYYPPYDRWFENRIYPSPNGLSIYFQDITERKRAEEELRASGQQLRSIIRNSPGAVYRCGYAPHWTIDYISDAITEISGYPASDFIHDRVRSYVSMIHPDDWPRVEAEAARCLEAKAPYEVEYRIFRADASVRWVSDRGQGIYDE